MLGAVLFFSVFVTSLEVSRKLRAREDREATGQYSTELGFEKAREVLECFHALKCHRRYVEAKSLARQFYKFHLEKNGEVRDAELFLFCTLGSSRETMQLLDAIDNGFMFRMKEWIQGKLSYLLKIADNSYLRWNRFVWGLVASLTFYYVDLCKDIALAIQFKVGLLGNQWWTMEAFAYNAYPSTLLYVILVSMSGTEILNITSVLFSEKFKPFPLKKRFLLMLAGPLLPGISIYRWKRSLLALTQKYRKLSIKLHDECVEATTNFASLEALVKEKEAKHKIALQVAHLRMNENVIEHFVQFVLIVIVFLTEHSRTRAVQTVGAVIVDGSLPLLALSAGSSLFSVVKDHVTYIEVKKAGHLPFAGQIVTAVYMLVGVISRLVAFLIFFTPLLGMLDVLELARFGTIKGSDDFRNTIVSFKGNTMADYWEPFETSPETFFTSHSMLLACTAIPPALIVIHFLFGCTVMSFLSGDSERWHLLFTLVVPPLFHDWEDIYRQSKEDVTIQSCWVKSILSLTLYLVLFAIEHAALCIPLAMLKYFVALRVADMRETGFPLLPEEEESVRFIDLLFYSFLGVCCLAVPLLQLLLALIYFKYGHAWSRVLNREASVFFPWCWKMFPRDN